MKHRLEFLRDTCGPRDNDAMDALFSSVFSNVLASKFNPHPEPEK